MGEVFPGWEYARPGEVADPNLGRTRWQKVKEEKTARKAFRPEEAGGDYDSSGSPAESVALTRYLASEVLHGDISVVLPLCEPDLALLVVESKPGEFENGGKASEGGYKGRRARTLESRIRSLEKANSRARSFIRRAVNEHGLHFMITLTEREGHGSRKEALRRVRAFMKELCNYLVRLKTMTPKEREKEARRVLAVWYQGMRELCPQKGGRRTKHARKFVERVRAGDFAVPECQLSVPEKQERGAWHFHIASPGFVSIEVVFSVWQRVNPDAGFVFISGRGEHEIAEYLAKYITKALVTPEEVAALQEAVVRGIMSEEEAIRELDRRVERDTARYAALGVKDLPAEYCLVADFADLVAELVAEGWRLVFHCPVGKDLYLCAFRCAVASEESAGGEAVA